MPAQPGSDQYAFYMKMEPCGFDYLPLKNKSNLYDRAGLFAMRQVLMI